MASSSAPLQEWLVIALDFEGALEKRLAVRQEHLGGLKADPESFWLWGGTRPFRLFGLCFGVNTLATNADSRVGAMLEEPPKEGEAPKMKGSAMLIGANTKEEVIERLKKDVYVKGGVWDWDKVQIIPFKSALRKAL